MNNDVWKRRRGWCWRDDVVIVSMDGIVWKGDGDLLFNRRLY